MNYCSAETFQMSVDKHTSTPVYHSLGLKGKGGHCSVTESIIFRRKGLQRGDGQPGRGIGVATIRLQNL